jgi:hypothetical protein
LQILAFPLHDIERKKGDGRSGIICSYLAVFMLYDSLLHATIFGKIQGLVHDPQRSPRQSPQGIERWRSPTFSLAPTRILGDGHVDFPDGPVQLAGCSW